MNRRKFIGAVGAVAGGMALPYILPSGSLFAKTGSRKVGHVVFCLFAGGVRNMESVHQNEGNLMPALLKGTESTMPGVQPVPSLSLFRNFQEPLQQYGTLFKEFRYKQGPPGHFNGHTIALTGIYQDTGLNIKQNPPYPTIFEYYRKHSSPTRSALNAWWVADTLGPYPALNFSAHADYGAKYGANFMSPTSLFSLDGFQFIGNMKFWGNDEFFVRDMRNFLDANFSNNQLANSFGIINTPEDAERLRQFVQKVYDKARTGGFNNLMNGMVDPTNDVIHLTLTEELLKEFQPELTVVNMQNVDIAHQNFTQYCNNLKKADYAVAHLWDTIQSIPGMRDDTVLIIAPEHGRNFEPNSIRDTYGRFAVDHTDEIGRTTAREIFCMIVGPSHIVKQNQVIGTPSRPVGETIDVAATIAHLLGFYTDIPSSMRGLGFSGRYLEEAFV